MPLLQPWRMWLPVEHWWVMGMVALPRSRTHCQRWQLLLKWTKSGMMLLLWVFFSRSVGTYRIYCWPSWIVTAADCPGYNTPPHTIKHIMDDCTWHNLTCQEHNIHSLRAVWESLVQAKTFLRGSGVAQPGSLRTSTLSITKHSTVCTLLCVCDERITWKWSYIKIIQSFIHSPCSILNY